MAPQTTQAQFNCEYVSGSVVSVSVTATSTPCQYLFQVSGSNLAGITWYVVFSNNVAQTYTGNNVTVNFPAEGLATVSVFGTSNGNNFECEGSVVANTCNIPCEGQCPDPCVWYSPHITLPNGWRCSTANPSGVQWVNKKIIIPDNAVVHFDRNVSMNNCSVKCGKNARIEVEGTASNPVFFTGTNHTVLSACEKMWTGIVFNANTGTIQTGTEIRQAKKAMEFKPGLRDKNCRLQSCKFIDNLTGIWVGSAVSTDPLTQFQPQIFAFNKFEKVGSLLPAEPTLSSTIRTGVVFVRCNAALIRSRNDFSEINIGIRCNQTSSLSVSNCTFSKMRLGGNNTGSGIYGSESSIVVSACQFTECADKSLYSLANRSIIVERNEFASFGKYGVYIAQAPANAIQRVYKANTFMLDKSTEVSAIYFERSPSASTTGSTNAIVGNTITVTNTTKDADISLIDVRAPAGGKDYFPIRENLITVASRSTAIHGIYVRGNQDQLAIARCTLSYTYPTAPAEINATLGIAVENVNGKQSRIDSNQVTTPFYFQNDNPYEWRSYVKCGIHLNASANFKMCVNKVDKVMRGYHFGGNVFYCDFAYNTHGRHYLGTHCEGGNCNMGNQDWHKNLWYGAFEADGARWHGGTGTPPFKFRIDRTMAFQWPSKIAPDPGWFENKVEETANTYCGGASFQPPSISWHEHQIIRDSTTFDNAVQEWDAKRGLVLKFLHHPSLLDNNTEAADWFDKQMTESPGLYATAQKMLGDALLDCPTSTTAGVAGLQAQMGTIRAQLEVLDSLQRADSTSLDPGIAHQADSLGTLLGQKGHWLDSLLVEISEFKIAKLQDVANWSSDLPAQYLHEVNRKTLHRKIIQKFIANEAGMDLNAADYDTIRTIADQCVEEGGLAVRQASEWLPHESAIEYLREDRNFCDTSENRAAHHVDLPLRPTRAASVYPNPSDGRFMVQIPEATHGTWSITDMAGRERARGSLPADSKGTFEVNCQQLTTGIYFFRIVSEGWAGPIQKISISH
ncbi:MAG: right-handed parallel beta-helix repeat-containing protein [Saprospiraceae bacterium]